MKVVCRSLKATSHAAFAEQKATVLLTKEPSNIAAQLADWVALV